MKKLLTIFAVMALFMALGSSAHALEIWEAPGYTPSTNITFNLSNPSDTGWGNPGPTGYRLVDMFQLNLSYGQAAGTDADVDAFNNWPGPNWQDPQEYILTLNLNAAEVFIYDGNGDDNDQAIYFDWTVTGWTNTILAGNLVDIDMDGSFSNGDFLQVEGGYRSFPNNPNAVEVWGGQSLATEVTGYTIDLTSGVLVVNLVNVDDDGDGFTENQGDCNDNDLSIYPDATEILDDGIDQDCNGSDLITPSPGCFISTLR